MKHTLTLLTTALCLSLVSHATHAFSQPELQHKMQTLVAQKAKADQPGFTVLVRKGDQVMLRGGYGMANLELAVPMQANSNLRLASQTKQFTAMAVLQLVHAGKISLQHKVGAVLKDYPAVGRDISIHQLLTHTSGIPNLSRMPEFKENKAKDATLAEMLALFNDKPLQFTPGSRFMYSNSNYVLLTAIIEAASQQSYADYLQQHIFQPLGMKHTGYDNATAIIPNRAAGYDQNGSTFQNAAVISMTRPQGAGALHSTVDDMNLWDQALYGNKLVPQALLQQSFIQHPNTEGQPQPYGYGWMMADLEQLPTQEHSGGIEGFSSYIIRIPAEQVYVVVLANSSYFDSYTLAVKLAAIAIGKPIEPKAIVLSTQTKQAIVGNYSFDDGTERHISLQQGELVCQTLEGPTQKLIPTADGKLYLEDDISYLTLGKVNAGKAELALVIRGFGTFPAKRLK